MKICLVAHYAYGAMKGGQEGHIGGVERQTALMSRWLASRGHEVSVVTWREPAGSPADEWIDGVRVIKLCPEDAGLPGLRFFIPRWTTLWRALSQADADLYYQNCAECTTGQVALWCRLRKRRFIFSVASDPECDPELHLFDTYRERWLYRYGLRHADCVITQTERQQRMLDAGFSLPSRVLPMPCEGPAGDMFRPPEPPRPDNARVVWVGRIAPVKRLELLLDVAARLPAVTFDVVGKADTDSRYVEPLLERARAMANVDLRGPVARKDMPDVYRSASLLCCTSTHEGFPNTFLEAWSHGVPIVSTVDPDNLIAARRIGGVGEDAASLACAVEDLVSAPQSWRKASAGARALFMEQFSVDSAMSRFESLFSDTVCGMGMARRTSTGLP